MSAVRSTRSLLACSLILAALVVAGVVGAGEIPSKVNYQGRLVSDGGEALPGSHTAVFRIFDAESEGTALWSETQPIVADSSGVFGVILGSVDSIDAGFDGPRWLELEVDGEILKPRRELVSVPFAFQAANAHMVGGLHADAFADSAHGHSSLEVASFSMPAGAAAGRVLTSDAAGVGTWQPPEAAPDGDWTIAGSNMFSAVPGRIGIGTADPLYKVQIADSSEDVGRQALHAEIASPTADGGVGVLGGTWSSSASIPTMGVLGISWSSSGFGIGVYGGSNGETGKGIQGVALHASGANYGVYGRTASANGYAGFFEGGRNYFQGRVGIGVNPPLQKLHVADISVGGLKYAVKVENRGNTDGTATGILFKVDGEAEASPDRGKGAIVYERTGTYNRGEFHILQDSGANTDVASLDDAVVTVKNNGRVVIGTGAGYSKLYVNETSNEAQATAIYATSSSTTAQNAAGVIGAAESDDPINGGVGVAGWATSSAGDGVGVWGETAGATGLGVQASATHGSGRNFGIKASTASPSGYAGYFLGGRNYFEGNVGIGWDSPGPYPLYVTSKTLPDSIVVIRAFHDSFSGRECGGVWGQTNSSDGVYSGYGVRGTAGANHGTGRGVIGEAYADSGVAVLAAAEHHTGDNFGIMAYTESPNGYAAYFGGRCWFTDKVGMGTRTPLRKLHIYEDVNGALSYPIKLENYGSANGTATGILFKVDGGNEDRGKGAIVYERTDTWNRGDFHILQRTLIDDWGPATLNDAVVTIKNNGNVGIGTKTPGYKLQVGAAGDGSQARANAWNLLSSREYKRDIEPLDPAECSEILEQASATDVVRYRFANDPSGVRHLGVIAEESPPEIVAADGKGVSLGDYSAFLLAAIKAQQAEIEALKAQVRNLESRMGSR